MTEPEDSKFFDAVRPVTCSAWAIRETLSWRPDSGCADSERSHDAIVMVQPAIAWCLPEREGGTVLAGRNLSDLTAMNVVESGWPR